MQVAPAQHNGGTAVLRNKLDELNIERNKAEDTRITARTMQGITGMGSDRLRDDGANMTPDMIGRLPAGLGPTL